MRSIPRKFQVGIVAGLILIAYLPSLGGEFLSDDYRFIVLNEEVHHLSLRQAFRYFTDPETQATTGYDIYRPLRTLDFAIDWSIAGDSPVFFRLRNLAYHLLASVLVLALLRRLLRDSGTGLRAPAFLGALLFALHPVQAESVAFVSSRGDLLMICLFLGALLLHLSERTALAALLMVGAMLSKEVGAVFPAAAFLADGLLRRRRNWRAYALYAALAVAFAGTWLLLVKGGDVSEVAQRPGWPGGSWATGLLTAGKGLLYDLKVLVFPVDLVFDWHLPWPSPPWILDFALAAAGFGILAVGVIAGRRTRFAALWFLVTILPVAGILYPMTVPTSDRFLLLPSVALCLLAGPLLARFRLAPAVLVCFLALTASRSVAWTSVDAMVDATLPRVATPQSLGVKAWRLIRELNGTRDPKRREALAREVLDTVDRFFELFPEDRGARVPPALGAELETRRAEAWLHLGRPGPALESARAALARADNPAAHEAAGVALERQGDLEGAAREQILAIEGGLRGPGQWRRLGELQLRRGIMAERAGDLRQALLLYRDSWKAFPDPEQNAAAREGIERLGR